jgi:hypothetical protein
MTGIDSFCRTECISEDGHANKRYSRPPNRKRLQGAGAEIALKYEARRQQNYDEAANRACSDGESERHILQQSGSGNGDSGAEQKQRQRVEHHHAVQCRRLIASEVFMPPAEKAEDEYDHHRQ